MNGLELGAVELLKRRGQERKLKERAVQNKKGKAVVQEVLNHST